MSFIGSFTGSDQKGEIDRGYKNATTSAQGGLDTANADYNQAYGLYDPYAQTGGNAMKMYANATGVNGQGAYQDAVNGFSGDPFRNSNEMLANKSLANSFGGKINNGAFALAAARGSLERGSTDWNNWLDRLNGQAGMGFNATGAQAGIRTGQGGLNYMAGQSQADRDTSYANARAAADGTLWNNITGLVGAGIRGATPGYGGQTPFGNMMSMGRTAANNLSSYYPGSMGAAG